MTTAAKKAVGDIALVRAALGAEYEILGELGRGGMAIVYHARDRELGREVAVKVLPFALAFDEGVVERFQREARTAAQLEHPHIIPIYRVGRSGQVIYFVMKYLRGRSLSSLLEEQGTLGAAETRRILLETASALGYAHARGVVHRDVKPDNIILDDGGRCVVADFGIARSTSESKLTATGMSVGTPRYMSPEQARAKRVDGRSDLYSLGVVGYECLVGQPPFDGDDAFAVLLDHINAPVPRPALSTTDEWVVFEAIERLLAKDPDDRFQTGDDLVEALCTVSAPAASATGRGAAFDAQSAAARTAPRRAIGASGDSGPRPSAALDRALDIAVAAGGRAFRTHGPKMAAASRVVARGVADGGAVALRALDTARTYAATRSRTFWAVVATSLVVAGGGVAGVHFGTKHRSRCARAAIAPGADSVTASRSLSLLVDAVGAQTPGRALQLYYDVCGLPKGAPFSTRAVVSRNESGLRRFLGSSVSPVVMSFDETADGPSTRRHETLDIGELPSGSYGLDVVITDERGRRREKVIGFQILAR
ncbi:MAG: hypothetical protein NVS9B3_05350 [Gemmatimonadaceae bacterium]